MSDTGNLSTGSAGEPADAMGASQASAPVDEPLKPEAFRYWKDKFACWEYSDCHLSFPSVPAGTQMHGLFTQDQVSALELKVASLRAQLAALERAGAAALSSGCKDEDQKRA